VPVWVNWICYFRELKCIAAYADFANGGGSRMKKVGGTAGPRKK